MTATWTTPRTWVTGEVVTSAFMNIYVRDNADWLKTPLASSVTFTADFTTTSATYVDVTGATATVTSNGGGFLVIFNARVADSTASRVEIDILVDGISESTGATNGVWTQTQFVAANSMACNFIWKISAKTAGAHTIKLQAKTAGGTLSVFGTTAGSPVQFYVVEFGA